MSSVETGRAGYRIRLAVVVLVIVIGVTAIAHSVGYERGHRYGRRTERKRPEVTEILPPPEARDVAGVSIPSLERQIEWLSAFAPDAESVESQRAVEMRRTLDSIREELKRAGGEWHAWHQEVEPFRRDLAALFESVPEDRIKKQLWPARDGFVYSVNNVQLLMFGDLEESRGSEPNISPIAGLIHLSRQLREHGIHFIHVPIPTSLEVCPEFASDHVPPDGIVAPYLRKALNDLLEADVEVIDLLPTFMQARRQDPETPLYLEHDIHWSDAAVRMTAEAIAARLSRYPFVRQGQKAAASYTTEVGLTRRKGKYIEALDNRDDYPVIVVAHERVRLPDGSLFEPSDSAPIVVMGDSFAYYFSTNHAMNGGISAQIAKNTGLPISQLTSGGMLPIELHGREEQLLGSEVKVVIYVQDLRMLVPQVGWQLMHLRKPK